MIGRTATTRLTARGAAAPEVVWERYARPALWPTWSPQIRRVELDGEDAATARLRPGMSGIVHGPPAVRVRFVVQEVDEAARRWSWGVALRGPVPVALDLQHGVDPGRRGGTSTWLEVTGPSPFVAAYLPPAWWALRRLVRA